MAELPGEDRHERLRQAMLCIVTALAIFAQVQHAPHIQVAAHQLRDLREQCDDLFPKLWAELNIGEPPEWLQK